MFAEVSVVAFIDSDETGFTLLQVIAGDIFVLFFPGLDKFVNGIILMLDLVKAGRTRTKFEPGFVVKFEGIFDDTELDEELFEVSAGV